MLALGVVVLELLPLAQASAADPQSSPPPDDLVAGAARGVVGLLLVPDAQASASKPQSSPPDAAAVLLRDVVVAGGAAGVSLGIPQSSTGAGWLAAGAPDLDPPREGVLSPLGAAFAPDAQGLLELVELPLSSPLLALGVVLPLELAQASALAPQSSPPPDLGAELDFGVDGLEEDPQPEFQSSVGVALAGALLLALGVVLPRGAELPPEAQASALAPQSSFEAPLLAAGLAVVFAAVRLEVTDPQALVAAFQSSGSLLTGAAERDVEVLEPLEVLPTPQSSTGASHDSVGAPLDEPESRRNLKMLKLKTISRF